MGLSDSVGTVQSIDGWMADTVTLLDLLDVERAVMVADATDVLPGIRLASEHVIYGLARSVSSSRFRIR